MNGLIKWSFSPYDLKTWQKSNHRILFVGADPNGAKAHNIKDMGEWFRKVPEGSKNLFYKRTKIMLDSILSHVDNDERMKHMRFVDFKIYEGGAQADSKLVLKYAKKYKDKVQKFFISKSTPHYVIILGNHARYTFNKLKASFPKYIQFDDSTLAVLMPHPSSMINTDALKMACKNISIINDKNKFRPINSKVYRWSYDKNYWNDFGKNSPRSWMLDK